VNRARQAQLAAAVLEMRRPLSRVALLASQLRRLEGSPAVGALGDRIREAVAELDRQIGLSLRALLPEPARAPAEPCDRVLGEALDRVRPALLARGWRCEVPAPSRDPVRGDPERVRAAVPKLLRWATAGAGPGRIELSLVRETGRSGVRARVTGAAAAPDEAMRGELRLFALACGAELVEEDGAEEASAIVWFGPAEGGA
jgi:hypothetical protein